MASLLSLALIGIVVILDALDGRIEDTSLAALLGAAMPILGVWLAGNQRRNGQ